MSLEEQQRRDQVNRLLAEVTLLRMRGQLQEALERCREALAIDPASSFALEAQGDVLSGLGDHGEALESYRGALRLAPDRTELEEKVGLAALRISDEEDLPEIQQEFVRTAEAQREKRKTISTAVVWSVFLPGGGYFYLGDHSRGAVVFLAFLGLALYLVGVLMAAVAASASLDVGLLRGIWASLRTASAGSRVGFGVVAGVLVAIYVFSVLDSLRKARGVLLLPALPQKASPSSPGEPPTQ